MDPIVIDMSDIRKARRESRKRELKQKAKKVYDWAIENPTLSIPLAISAIGLLTTGVKGICRAVTKYNQTKLVTDLKELYVYDRSLGHYWKLRKPLNNSQWGVINNRVKDGERLGDILLSMKVLE